MTSSDPDGTTVVESWHLASHVAADITAIARLFTELGYPVDAATMSTQLECMRAIRDTVPLDLLVARDQGDIVGLASVAALDLVLGIAATAELRALVVLAERRGEGIGELLVHAAMAWARRQGAESLMLRTNVTRADAHRFYERLGFIQTKTSRTYHLSL